MSRQLMYQLLCLTMQLNNRKLTDRRILYSDISSGDVKRQLWTMWPKANFIVYIYMAQL